MADSGICHRLNAVKVVHARLFNVILIWVKPLVTAYFGNTSVKTVIDLLPVFIAVNVKLALCKLHVNSAYRLYYIRHTVKVYRSVFGYIKPEYCV